MPNKRLSIVVPEDVYTRLVETAREMGLKTNTLAARVIETADANGDYDISRHLTFECPFSKDRLHELRFDEKKSLLEIGELAKSVMEWEAAPRPAQVRLWIETAGFIAGRDRRVATNITARTRAIDIDLPEGHKRCPKCSVIKPLEGGYYKDKSRPTGYTVWCRTCETLRRDPASMRRWYERNREAQIQRSKDNKAASKAREAI